MKTKSTRRVRSSEKRKTFRRANRVRKRSNTSAKKTTKRKRRRRVTRRT